MKKLEMSIVALSHSLSQSHNYAVVLGELSGNRRLPVVIGAFEAQAIAVAMENMEPNRPLTHDLFKNTLDQLQVDLKEIIISNLIDGVFYAKMICVRDGELLEIDSRTSDALAMAVRFGCPIFTYEFILDAAGVTFEEGEEEVPEQKRSSGRSENKSLSARSMQELEELLNSVLAEEDYEQAASIRDEMKRRQQEG